MNNKITVGIDIGGTNTVFGIVNEKGEILKKGKLKTQNYSKPENFVSELSDKIKEHLKLSGNDFTLKGIGIGAPNGNYFSGNIDFAPNLPWKGKVCLVKLFKEHFDIPVIITNDANAAAMGEKIYGGAKNMNDFIVLTLGTGLGSGIYARGSILYGKDGTAGEYGHICIIPEGRQCACGKKGCLETYVSASGIKRTVFQFLAEKTENSPLRNISFNDLSGEKMSQLAQSGDKISLDIFNYTADILGKAIADIYSIFSPEAVFLSGGLANAGELLTNQAIKSANKNTLDIHKNNIKILISKLKNSDSAILGAASLVTDL